MTDKPRRRYWPVALLGFLPLYGGVLLFLGPWSDFYLEGPVSLGVLIGCPAALGMGVVLFLWKRSHAGKALIFMAHLVLLSYAIVVVLIGWGVNALLGTEVVTFDVDSEDSVRMFRQLALPVMGDISAREIQGEGHFGLRSWYQVRFKVDSVQVLEGKLLEKGWTRYGRGWEPLAGPPGVAGRYHLNYLREEGGYLVVELVNYR